MALWDKQEGGVSGMRYGYIYGQGGGSPITAV